MLVYDDECGIVETSIVKNESWCHTCGKIKEGQTKYKWRLDIPNSQKFHRGSFWTLQCEDCFKSSIDLWSNTINSIKEKLC